MRSRAVRPEAARAAPESRNGLAALLGANRRRPSLASMIFVTVMALTFFGLLMVLSASSVPSLEKSGDAFLIFWRQLAMAVAGMAALIWFARREYRNLPRIAGPLAVLTGALLVLVLIPGIGAHANGARRWIGWGWLGFQPAELAKLAVLVACSTALSRTVTDPDDVKQYLAPTLPLYCVYAVLVMLEPDLGTTVAIGICLFAVLWVAGLPKRAVFWLALAGAGGFAVLSLSEGYRRQRIMAFLNPWADAGDTGYHSVQSLIAVGSGGWTGLGLGAGRQKWMFLPNAHTDFVFAVIGEELGFLGCAVLVLLFSVLAWLGFRTAMRAPDRFGRILAGGITGWISLQAMVNILVAVGVLPITGVPLPFVSAGGSALVVALAAMGMLISIARTCEPRG